MLKEILEKIKLSSKIINNDEFNNIFDNTWLKMKKSFYKLESQQVYLCDVNKNYKEYNNGNKEALIEELKNFIKDWPRMTESKETINFKRLHLISLPLSEYLNYEMYFYLINEKHGEKIKCLEDKNKNLDDFIIFDNKEILISSYNENGEYLNFYYSSNENLIKKLLVEYNKLYKKAKSYKKYANFDKQLLTKIESIV